MRKACTVASVVVGAAVAGCAAMPGKTGGEKGKEVPRATAAEAKGEVAAPAPLELEKVSEEKPNEEAKRDPGVSQAALRPSFDPEPEATPSTPVVSSRGKVVATVGKEEVRVGEVKETVQNRLAALVVASGSKPSRKEIDKMTRAATEEKIVASIARQAAKERLGSDSDFDRLLAEIDRRWTGEELPRRISKNTPPTDAGYRATLGRRGRTLDDEREAFATHGLVAIEAGRADGKIPERDYQARVEELRKRFLITSPLTPGQIAASSGDLGADDIKDR